MSQTLSRYYLRVNVLDQPGVIADISTILRDLDISIEDIVQHGDKSKKSLPIVITTHETRRGDVIQAVEQIEKLGASTEKPCLIAIEDL